MSLAKDKNSYEQNIRGPAYLIEYPLDGAGVQHGPATEPLKLLVLLYNFSLEKHCCFTLKEMSSCIFDIGERKKKIETHVKTIGKSLSRSLCDLHEVSQS